MTRQGYFFCDRCEELASGPRCEHCNAFAPTVRWIHVPLHPQRGAGPNDLKPTLPRHVSQERGRDLWCKLHEQLKF